MKTHDTSSENDSRSRAAANEAQQKTKSEKGSILLADSTAQCKEARTIDSSPFMVSQTKRLRALSGQAVQRQDLPEEEEPLQGKAAAQKQSGLEDEELLQGKSIVQRQSPEEEELMQGKFMAQIQNEGEDNLLQGKLKNSLSGASKRSVRQPLQKKTKPDDENRTSMPGELKDKMENAFSANFSDVRIHPNSGKATEVGALAYTQGSDVHFAPGQFKPETSSGRQLLGHELVHVVQQHQGRVRPTGEVAGMPVNDSQDLENEADRLAKKVEK